MQPMFQAVVIRAALPAILLTIALVFAACPSGSSNGGDDPNQPPVQSTISGVAFKGRFTSGTARASTITATGTIGSTLAEVAISATGEFQIDVGNFTGPVHIAVIDGTFIDEVTGNATQSGALTAVLASGGGNPAVVVTPLTHMTAALALREINLNGTPVAQAINAANGQIVGYFQVTAMLTTQPAILSEGPAVAGNAANYGAILAGISQQAFDLGVGADAMAAALGSDSADGIFDGLAFGDAIMLGAGSLPADAARGGMAASIGTFLASGANTSTLAAGNFTALLDRLNSVPPEILFVESIAVTPENLTIAQGMQVQYAALATFSDGTQSDISGTAVWDSSDGNVAAISTTGLATAGSTPGPTIISAAGGAATGQTGLDVGNFTMASIAVTPDGPTLAPGQTQQFTATATYSDTSTANITALVDWQSSDTNLLTINAAGLATMVAVGTPSVTATELGTTVDDSTVVTITVSYNANIQPIFNAHCIACHSGSGAPLGLRLANYSLVMQGSQNGPVVLAGNPDGSKLIQRMEGTIKPQMPQGATPLPQSTIDLIRIWIQLGALNN